MLRGLLDFVRVGFSKRMILYEIVVISLTVFGTFPNIMVKLALFCVFLAASSIFLTIFTSQFVTQLRLICGHRQRVRVQVPKEFADLSREMGVEIGDLGVVKGCNAYVIGKSLVLGLDLMKRLTLKQILAVVAHEIGHIKGRHLLFRLLAVFPFLMIPWFTWSRMHSPIFFTESLTQIVVTIMIYVAFLAYAIAVLTPINWLIEFRADKAAARYVGKENIASALLALTDEESSKESSETHPSIADRVRYIEKTKL